MIKKYFKSPMNYLGNKYKLLDQMIPLFPENINTFYDVFCGGLDVSLNVKANRVTVNDKHSDLIWLYSQIKIYDSSTLGNEIEELDKKYFPMNNYKGKALRTYDSIDKKLFKNLFNEKKDIYYILRDSLNDSEEKDFKIILLLMMNSFGLTEYRVIDGICTFSCGKGRVNNRIVNDLNIFSNKINKINFSNRDFRYINDLEFQSNDFVYLDPPYLGTSQYKVKWTENDEKDLYDLLDKLDRRGVKFALSNFEDGINHTNDYLSKWCNKYKIHKLNDNHSKIQKFNNKDKQEILVVNY